MKLPWVSREEYERQSRQLIERTLALHDAKAEVQAARDAGARWEALLMQEVSWRTDILKTMLTPTVLPSPVQETAPDIPREKTAIDLKIEEQAGGDAKVARYFRTQVRKMRLEGKSDGDILASIGWQTSETEAKG